MLDDRKTAILSAVVQEYIATAQPVGSSHIASASGVQVSSATVRNEMAVLEQEGFLIQPHTSAGRIPTDKGYRFFVDHLASPRTIDAAVTRQVGEFFAAAHGRLEEMLHQTSDLLTRLTHNAAVVVGPKAEAATVRSAQIVRLSTSTATVVLVLANGSVESRLIDVEPTVSDDALSLASSQLAAAASGRALAAVTVAGSSGDATVDALVSDVLTAVRTGSTADHVYVGGASTVAQAFDAVDVVRQVLQTLEQQFVVVSLVRDIVDRGMSVAIGVEHGVEPLSACSVVVAPVIVDGEHIGSVGVLGPTRMNYPQALATVDIVSDRLGRRLGRRLMADYYALLGVSRTVSADELKKAYRKKARELHPDANPGDPGAAERFKEVSKAYAVLSDDEQRARYDRFGEAGVNAGAGPNVDDLFGGGLGDIFDAFFGGGNPFGGGRRGPSGPPRGQDMEVAVSITFEQSVFGAQIPVEIKLPQACDRCGGSGAGEGTKPVTCSECSGSGQVRRVRQSVLGQMVSTSPCPRCGGLGEVITTPCEKCRGEGRITVDKTYNVDIPAGVVDTSTLRLTRRGAAGPRGGAPGDLYVHLRVRPHERFRRVDDDLVTDIPVSIAQASLGTKLTLTTLDGDEELVVHAGTQTGHEFVVRGKGVPRLHGRGRGDLRAIVRVEVPTKLTSRESELLREFADGRGETVGEAGGLFSKIKSAFS